MGKAGAPSDGNNRIVVAGDISVDWFQIPMPAKDGSNSNWRLMPGTRMIAQNGGALLLADIVEGTVGSENIARQRLENIEQVPPETAIHSNVALAPFPIDGKNSVYRVSKYHGFDGPTGDDVPAAKILEDVPDPALVVIDDAGNGYRDAKEGWPLSLKGDNNLPLVVYKAFRPLAKGALWQKLNRSNPDGLITVVSIDDLRLEGMNVSRQLSWDRTAMDFAEQIEFNPRFEDLASSRFLVVRIGLEGVLLYENMEGDRQLTLIFDPAHMEGGYLAGIKGDMMGRATAFVSTLAIELWNRRPLKDAQELREGLVNGLKCGIGSARHLVNMGFGSDAEKLKYPIGVCQTGEAGHLHLSEIGVPLQRSEAERNEWSILKRLSRTSLEEAAYGIIEFGKAEPLEKVPFVKYGGLTTFDRGEIESFQSIRNLIQDYMKSKKFEPLSIAVFGPPGAGKSFGVKEVARSVNKNIEIKTFNLSQFTSERDLVSAFHKVRDIVLKGKMPLVFFDEFDSGEGGRKLMWLKSFLAPMQDGEFKDGEEMHPIGKSIFVFAGGTSDSFRVFAEGGAKSDGEGEGGGEGFVDAKGPDFISRLRGYVDILGPNRQSEQDDSHVIRRALILRSMLKRKCPQLLNSDGRLNIDHDVLRAFIATPDFKHGARSMDAIMDMSSLQNRERFEPAALPSEQQLVIHAGSYFMELVLKDTRWAAKIEYLAQRIHDSYRDGREGKAGADDEAMKPWAELDEEYRESNRKVARSIEQQLADIGYGIRPVLGKEGDASLGEKEIELLAEKEHVRWMEERTANGWTLGEKNQEKKQNPNLVPWEDLDPEMKEWNLKQASNISKQLHDAGFEAYERR